MQVGKRESYNPGAFAGKAGYNTAINDLQNHYDKKIGHIFH